MATKTLDLEQMYKCNPKYIWRQLREENIGFWLVLGYVFFEYVRPQSIYPWLQFLPWTAICVYCMFFFSLFSKEKKYSLNLVDGYILFFSTLVILSGVFAVDPSISFAKIELYLAWPVIYFGIVRTVTTRARFFFLLLFYFLCNFKMSQHGFLSWASRGFSFDDWGVSGSPGWFNNSGEFGIQMCIFTPMAVAFVWALHKNWGKWTLLFILAMPITAMGSIVASSSRGALVGLLASGMWSMKNSKHFFRAAAVLTLSSIVIFLVLPEESKARFESSGSDRTSTHRLERWRHGLETMREYPILGVGFKNWEDFYPKNFVLEDTGTLLVHNIFIEAGTETGFSGLIVFLLLCLAILRLNNRVRKAAANRPDLKFEYVMSFGLDAALVGLLVSASFITVLYYPYIWIHAALCSCFYNVSIVSNIKSSAHQSSPPTIPG